MTPEEVRKLQISGGREQIGANENWGQINAAPGGKPEVVSTTPPTIPPKMPPRPGAGGPAAPAGGGITTLPSENDAIKRFKDALGTSTEPTVKKEDFLKELGDISKPAYDKANTLIETEKGRLKEGKEQDFYMSLIQGGLAAAGESGPNALQNIAKGFEKGAANYSSALKDFRKASQENAKMELELSRAQAADKKGDVKAYYDHQEKAMDRQARKDDRVAAGISSIISTTEHGKYSLLSAQEHTKGQIAAASMPGANERLFATLGGGKDQASVVKGMRLFQDAQTDKTGLGFAKLYVDHVAEANKAGTTPMSESVFLDTMTRLASQFNPKTVIDPKQGNLYGRP